MARVVVIGRSGTGKSYYAGYLLEQVVPEFDLAIHFDIEDEEGGLSHPDHDPIYRRLSIGKEAAGRLNWPKVIGKQRKLRIVPEDLTIDELRTLYAEVCRSVMWLCKGARRDLTAFVSADESHILLPQEDFREPCERMITGGRKHGVECLHITQRPQLLHTTVISQADKRVYFGVSDDNDIRKIEKMSAFPAGKLRDLPSRQCIVENKNTGEWEQRETDGVDRKRPHFSGDDGIVDEYFPV